MEINTKLSVGDEAFYVSLQGKVKSDKVESISIAVGSSTYKEVAWSEGKKTPVQVVITYKLENQPAGYILTEDSVHRTKEELLGNAQ